MTDINLLKNTESPEERKKKKKSFFSFPMTKSRAEKSSENELKPKSSGSQPYAPASAEEKKEPEKFGQPKGEVEDIFAKANGEKKEETPPKIEYTESETEKLKKEAKERKFSFFKRLFSRRKKESPPPFPAAKPSKPQKEETDDVFRVSSSSKVSRPLKPEYSQPLNEKEPEKGKKPAPAKPAEPLPGEKEIEESFLVNLLPEELVGREAPKKKLISLALASLGAIFLVILVYFGLSFYQSNIVTQTQEVRNERVDLEGQITALKDEQEASIAFKQKLDAVKSVIDEHVYWSKFFEKLEKYTIKDVYYTGAFSGSLGASISLSALTKDFTSVAEQLVVFQNAPDFLENVTITGAQKSASAGAQTSIPGAVTESLVSFSVSLELVPDVFYNILEETEEETTEEAENTADSEIETNININLNLNLNSNSSPNLNLNLNSASQTNSVLNTNSSGNLNTNISNLNTNTALNLNSDLNFNTNANF